MELVLAILLFTLAAGVFAKYLEINDESHLFLVFLKGALKAIIFMLIVLVIAYFLPNFTWSNIWDFFLVTMGLALVSGVLDVVRKTEL